mmetsp:Transcript_1507/g.2857  ORF Transcript_1507/g.2857 Transcript_1507/m.2857 type:complete len:103 (-) Transcript_1507:426-734(-)
MPTPTSSSSSCLNNFIGVYNGAPAEWLSVQDSDAERTTHHFIVVRYVGLLMTMLVVDVVIPDNNWPNVLHFQHHGIVPFKASHIEILVAGGNHKYRVEVGGN